MKSPKFSKKSLTKAVAVACLPLMSLGFVSAAKAEVTIEPSMSIASMYLWRGQDVSDLNPAISGALDVGLPSGLYVGTWMSSEGKAGSYEVDLYGGWGGSSGDISYGIGLAGYYYPQTLGSVFDSDIYEVIVNAGFKDYGITAYINAEQDDSGDYKYISIDGPIYGAFSAHVGITMQEDADYTDFNISYAATENLSWTVSMAMGDGVEDQEAAGRDLTNPLVMVSYSVPLK